MADKSVIEWRLVVRRGHVPRRNVSYTMGKDAKGEARASEALDRWTNVERHATDEVWIESREVAPWRQETDQQSLQV